MALTAIYQRLPISGGDNNAYHIPVMQNMRRGSIGANSIDISNVAGALNVDLGFAGINDGTANGEGVLQITVGGTFSLAGSTAGAWHALEFSESGTSCTFYLTALAAYTDESFMHADMKGYWSAAKLGYYRIASRRVLAFVFIRAGTVLGRIVNTENGVKGFKGITIEDYITQAGAMAQVYIAIAEIEIGDWNMPSNAQIYIVTPFALTNIRQAEIWVRPDVGAGTYAGRLVPLKAYFNSTLPLAGGEQFYDVVNKRFYVHISLAAGDPFNNTDWDSTGYNRGWVRVKYET